MKDRYFLQQESVTLTVQYWLIQGTDSSLIYKSKKFVSNSKYNKLKVNTTGKKTPFPGQKEKQQSTHTLKPLKHTLLLIHKYVLSPAFAFSGLKSLKDTKP